MAASFEDVLEEENIWGQANTRIFVDVYPTHIQEYFVITTNSPNQEHYELYDARGVKVMEGDFTNTIKVETSALPTGVYIVNTCGKVLKLMKE